MCKKSSTISCVKCCGETQSKERTFTDSAESNTSFTMWKGSVVAMVWTVGRVEKIVDWIVTIDLFRGYFFQYFPMKGRSGTGRYILRVLESSGWVFFFCCCCFILFRFGWLNGWIVGWVGGGWLIGWSVGWVWLGCLLVGLFPLARGG